MDAKRSNAHVARQGGGNRASKTSVASRHGGGGGGAGGGDAVARKQVSQVSLTPSQSRNQDNSRKSPLDALSRSGVVRNQDPFQRRSGLQDVDESFLASNAFARPSRVRNSGLDREVLPQSVPAGVPTGQMSSATVSGQPQVDPIQQQQQMPPQQQQQQQQQQQPPVCAVPSQQQMQQQYMQQPAAGQPTRMEPFPMGRAHGHQQHQQQQPQPQQPAVFEQQQQQPEVQSQNKYQQQPQQGYPSAGGAPAAGVPSGAASGLGSGPIGAAPANPAANREAGGGAAAPPDAEMCTTCPNCQTTIYLVRSPEMGNGDGGSPIQ